MSVPVRWPGKTFFYPIGNTPAVNLTQSLPPEGDASLLLLGCGDPRSIIYTLYGENKRARKLDFTCCDVEPAVLARNVLLLTLVMDGHPIDQIWNVFYHYSLDDASLALLTKQCNTLLSVSSDLPAWRNSLYYPNIQFSTSHTLVVLRWHWRLYTAFPKLPKMKHQAFRDEMRKMMDWAAPGGYYSAALAAGVLALDSKAVADENLKLYRKTGVVHPVAAVQAAAKHINPTFVYSILGDACVFHHGTYPLQGFHIGEAFASMTNVSQIELVACVTAQFRRWCAAWKQSLSKTTVRFAVGEAIVFCRTLWNRSLTGSKSASLYVSPWIGAELVLDGEPEMPISFDVIDSSNLPDFIGVLNILIATSSLLTPAPSSTLQTETLLGVGKNPVQGFVERLCADIPTFAALLGIAPIGYLSGFHTESNVHEIVLSRPTFDIAGLEGQKGFHERLSWKLLPPIFPSIDPKTLARLLFNVYLELFGPQEDLKISLDQERLQQGVSGVIHYHRHTFVVLLSFLKGRFHIYNGSWGEVIGRLFNYIVPDRTLVFGTNFIQEMCALMHTQGIHTILPYKQPQPCFGEVFEGWGSTAPPVVCLALVCPKHAIGMHNLLSMPQDDLGTVMFKMGIMSNDAHNTFSAIQIVYGRAKAIGKGPNKRLEIEEDEGGWASSSPDASLIVSAWVPSVTLMSIHIPSARVIFHIHETVSTMIQGLPNIFGQYLAVHAEDVLNRDAVHVLVSRPGRPYELETLKASTPQSPPAAPRMAVMKFDEECKTLKDMTIRETITQEDELKELRSGVKVEVVHTTGLCNAMAEFGKHSKSFTFPLPVDSVSARLRIARQSGYLELVSPPIAPGVSRQVVYVTLAPVLRDITPVSWNIHYLNLDICPTFKQGKKRYVHVPHAQCSLAMSDRERAIRERGIKSGLIGAPENLAVLNVKDSIYSIIVRSAEFEAQKYRIFSLSDEKRGGVYATIFVNRLCLDVSSHTITLDCNVVFFEAKMVFEVVPLLHNPEARNQKDTIHRKVDTSGDETLAWLHLFPAFVERCRTWSHKSTCEYKKAGRIPVSSTYGKMPLCRCGLGQDLGSFFDDGKLTQLKQYATRAAISPLYAVSYLEDVGDSMLDDTSKPTASNPRGCAKCGVVAKEGNPLRLCSRCKKTKYCGAECQKSDWDTHKHFCKASSK